jgi:hypothetical protein
VDAIERPVFEHDNHDVLDIHVAISSARRERMRRRPATIRIEL